MKNKFLILSFVLLLPLLGAGCIQFGATSASGPLGVFRSATKGDTWQAATAFPTPQGVKSIADIKVFRFYNDPGDPNALYLGSRSQGLYYTYDNGDSWRSFPFFSGKFIYGLAVDPKDKCTIYASDGTNVYKTMDCGRSWILSYNEARDGQRLVSLAVDYGTANTVYGGILGGDIVKSIDGGKSWKVMKRFGFDLQYLTADPLTSGRVYAASYSNGLFRTDDGGENWINLGSGLDNFSDSKSFYRLVLHPSKKDSLFWISKYGILRSGDAGATWTDIKLLTPPGSVKIYAFAVSPKNDKEMYYTGTVYGQDNKPLRSTFYRSVDGGETWLTKKLPTVSIPAAFYINPDSGLLLAGFTVLDK